MKILHVVPSYEPAWAFGGTVTATSELCRALARQGVDVTVYTTDADGKGGHLEVPLDQHMDLGGVKVSYFHCDFGVKKAFYSMDLSKRLKETITDFDLVHVSAIWQLIQVDVYKICKSFLKPYIVSTHGSFSPWPWNQKLLRKSLYWHLFGKKTIKHATAIHFACEDERVKSFSTVPLLTTVPSFVVPNGISVKKGKNIRKSLNISDDKFVLLFVGRVKRIKGIHLVLEALRKINDKSIIFLIVGQKQDFGYLKYLRIVSDDLPNEVIWHDPVNRDRIWDFYCSSNLFVLPSYSENFGISIIEAMASGLPVLVSKNVGIWREVQSDDAGIVINQDVEEITAILRNLSTNPETLNRMSQKAKNSVKNRYDINKVASLMIRAYEDILIGKRSPELRWK